MDWQPIETFPDDYLAPVLVTDGIDIYWADMVELCCDLTGTSAIAYKVFGQDTDADRAFRMKYPYTHWMPLPEAPE